MLFLKFRWLWGHVSGLIATGLMLSVVNGLQAQVQQSRISGDIGENQMVPLRNTVSPRVAHALDRGQVSPATRIEGMTIYFQPTAEQTMALNQLLTAQQTLGLPWYHQWLTPAEYANLFGMSNADLAKVEGWLQSQGFTIERVANSRNSIVFSGTAEEVENAFGTEIHNYAVDGESHFANATDISVPATLNSLVLSVSGLNDFRPRPQAHFHREPKPEYTSAQSGGHFLTPGDVATIYDIVPAYNAGYNGSGQTIAVLGQSAINVKDIEAFQKADGLTVRDPKITLVPSTGTSTVVSGDEAESDLDLEYASGIGQGATIDFVYAGNANNTSVYNALQYAVDNNIGAIISLSYGSCEPDLTQSQFTALDAILKQGASQGQSIIAASGDDGSTACYGDLATNTTPTSKEEELGVNYPASSAYATGIGGTEFPATDVTGSSASTYWQSASGSDVISSALSYIPEVVWNDDSAQVGTQYGAQYALSAGGGGVSVFASRPSWQSGVTGIASGSKRLVPDISLNSSADVGGYLYCTSDTSAWSSGQKASCNSGFRDSASGFLTVGGGTSFGTPIFAGMVAILNQKAGSNQGLLNSKLYTLAANAATYTTAFHDITSGKNACTAGSKYCSSAGAGSYSAGTGYDEATGLGSIDFNALMAAWTGSTTTGGGGGTGSAGFTLAATSVSVSAGSSVTSTVTVTPVNSFTGTVSLVATASGALATNGCYSIGNASITGSSAVTSTLTIYTSQSQCGGSSLHSFAKIGGVNRASAHEGWPGGGGLPFDATAMSGLLLFGFKRIRQAARSKLWLMMAVITLALTAGLSSGCGSSSGGSKANSANVTAGSYAVTVTGTSTSRSSVTASTSLTVTVQ